MDALRIARGADEAAEIDARHDDTELHLEPAWRTDRLDRKTRAPRGVAATLDAAGVTWTVGDFAPRSVWARGKPAVIDELYEELEHLEGWRVLPGRPGHLILHPLEV